jgi:sugar lactone lactonase YvrE
MRFVTCAVGAAAMAAGVTAFLLAGGTGLPATHAPGSPAGWVASKAASPASDPDGVYVVTGTASGQYVINEYALNDSNNANPLCSINAGTNIFPGDLAVDHQGNLWVPTIATPSISSVWEVVEYAPGCGAPLATLLDGTAGQPDAIAFDKKGTAFVANINSASFGPGNVAVFPPGQTTPSRVLTSPLFGGFVIAIAIDANDDVFVTCDTSSCHTQVVEFPRNRGHGTLVNVSGFQVIDGITFDDHQNMILTDYTLTQDEVYAPPYAGAPTATIPLVPGSAPLYSKLNKRNNLIYVTGKTGYNVYSYPAGTFQYGVTAQIGRGGAGGLAVDPKPRN